MLGCPARLDITSSIRDTLIARHTDVSYMPRLPPYKLQSVNNLHYTSSQKVPYYDSIGSVLLTVGHDNNCTLLAPSSFCIKVVCSPKKDTIFTSVGRVSAKGVAIGSCQDRLVD